MSNIEQTSVELLEKFENFAINFSQEAIDVSMTVIQVNALNTLWISCFVLVTMIIIMRYSYKYTKSDDEIKLVAGTSIFIFCCVIVIFLMTILLDMWTWIALFNPKLALAHKLLNSLI